MLLELVDCTRSRVGIPRRRKEKSNLFLYYIPFYFFLHSCPWASSKLHHHQSFSWTFPTLLQTWFRRWYGAIFWSCCQREQFRRFGLQCHYNRHRETRHWQFECWIVLHCYRYINVYIFYKKVHIILADTKSGSDTNAV